jgi:hypothetical protein
MTPSEYKELNWRPHDDEIYERVRRQAEIETESLGLKKRRSMSDVLTNAARLYLEDVVAPGPTDERSELAPQPTAPTTADKCPPHPEHARIAVGFGYLCRECRDYVRTEAGPK